MKASVDLHIHSVYSDGTCTVDEICTQAVSRGIRVIALSDHDTFDGLAPMAAALSATAGGQAIGLIPAIEMSSGENGLSHVLGYGVSAASEALKSELAALRRKRVTRIYETLSRLKRLTGAELSPEFLKKADASDRTVGRMHVARQMIAMRLVGSVEEAFGKYLGVGKPAFVPLIHMSTQSAIGVLRKAKTIPVLAHPMRAGIESEEELERYLIRLKDMGLMGIEVFHPSASRNDVQRLYRLARRYELLITGGSDFHGDRSMRTQIGEIPSGWDTWEQDVNELKAAISASNAS